MWSLLQVRVQFSAYVKSCGALERPKMRRNYHPVAATGLLCQAFEIQRQAFDADQTVNYADANEISFWIYQKGTSIQAG